MNPNRVLERHSNLYFTDGDVVLAVNQTPGTKSDDSAEGRLTYTLFRVHKFLLKHHSTVFANFFADANAAPTEVYDGVPLAEMHGDKAEDFALLLSYLYNPSSLVFKRNDPNTPLTVAGVVRLADKYLIEPLHRCLVQQVCADWPTTLNEYDIKQGEIDVLRKVALHNVPFQYSPDDDRQRLSDVIPEPASAILFGREFGCPQILPAAFYKLSLIPAIYDWSEKFVHIELARWSILDGDSLLKCMQGCQNLRLYRPHTSRFLSEDCALEGTDTPCYRFAARLFKVFREGPSPSTHWDPLRVLEKRSRFWEMPEFSEERSPDRPCDECREAILINLAEERKRIWGALPKYFNLD
ncbi:hypothetical protein V8D89_000395 [Ganoderma adspersum]